MAAEDVVAHAGELLARHGIPFSKVLHVSTDHLLYLSDTKEPKPMTAWLRCTAKEEIVFPDDGFDLEPSQEAVKALEKLTLKKPALQIESD